MAFIPATPLRCTAQSPSVSSSHSRTVCCSQQPPSSSSSPSPSPLSRRHLLQALLATSVAVAAPRAANAANGSGLEKAFSKVLFPKEGFNAPDAAGPPQVDQAILSKPEAKAALQKLRSYEQNISQLYAKFQEAPATTELTSTVRSMVSISDLRNALNVVNEAIDEMAQVETDKVVRGIIQDIGELENAAALKPGGTRTEKKIVRTTDWFDKLETDFKRLLAFYG